MVIGDRSTGSVFVNLPQTKTSTAISRESWWTNTSSASSAESVRCGAPDYMKAANAEQKKYRVISGSLQPNGHHGEHLFQGEERP
ncbi:MAG: hypothetical protein IPL86_13205 [Flavobacteriales bacterium]|nr:hypothetical protein [Flavobacteriales bacterium]